MKKNSAFSLLELSIVIAVVGAIIAGIMQSRVVLSKSRLSAAQTQTTQSPVPNIADLVGWWETTSERSFSTTEAIDASTITNWYDVNPQALSALNATQSTSGSRPSYKTNMENGLPMVYFSGTKYMTLPDGTVPYNDTSYTVFIVGKFSSTCSSGTCNIISSGAASSSNLNSFQYTSTAVKNNWNSSSLSATASIATLHIYSFTYKNSVGRKIYVDGTQTASDSTTSRTSTNATNLFGSSSSSTNITGYLGEVIIYQRALNSEERKSVEKYLSRKWGPAVS